MIKVWLPVLYSILAFIFAIFGCFVFILVSYKQIKGKNLDLMMQVENLTKEKTDLTKQLADLQNEDQYKLNKDLQRVYKMAVGVYEKLLDLQAISNKTGSYEDSFSKALNLISLNKFGESEEVLKKLEVDLAKENAKIASSFTIPANVTASNTAPASGFSRQKVTLDIGEYLVDLVAGDLGSTRVIVDTASDNSCANDCPVLALSDYVSRNGAFAGINGSYFCPASYPTCAGKTNSFDTLLMNKNKVYFNSDNNVYSSVPAVIFGGSYIRFVGRSSEWGRDTGIDSMIANQPLLVSGGNVAFGGDGDPKKGSKGSRSFVANKGNMVFIGVVHNATVAESARVLAAMGMENGLNLDSGGSTALWSGGYKVGPGRNIPNAILMVRK